MKHDSGTNRYSREVCPSSAAVSAPGFLLARAHPCRDMQLPTQGGWVDAASQSSTACGKTIGRGSGGLEPVARMSGAPLNRARSCLSQTRRDIRGTPACRHGGVPEARPCWLMRATRSVPSVDQASSPDERRAAQSCPLTPKPDAPRYPGTPACRHGGAPVARPRWLMPATQSVPSVATQQMRRPRV
jgi:hypothetical protein